MSFSKPNYKDFSFAHHGAVYRILEKLFAELNISYYFIGANARDVQLYNHVIEVNFEAAPVLFDNNNVAKLPLNISALTKRKDDELCDYYDD